MACQMYADHRNGRLSDYSANSWYSSNPYLRNMTRSFPYPGRSNAHRDEDALQPRSTTSRAWPYVGRPTTSRPSSPVRQPPRTRTWAQNRAGLDKNKTSGPSEASCSSSTSTDEAIAAEISLKLKLFFKALMSCKGVCEEYDGEFEQHAGKIPWAGKNTIDQLWNDMVSSHGKGHQLPKARDKLKSSLVPLTAILETATRRTGRGNKTKQDTEVLECRHLAARKAEFHCRELLDLLQRAQTERMAGRQLLAGVRELMTMLDPKSHPLLYDDDSEVKTPTQQSKQAVKSGTNANKKGNGDKGLASSAGSRNGSGNPSADGSTSNNGNGYGNMYSQNDDTDEGNGLGSSEGQGQDSEQQAGDDAEQEQDRPW